MNHNMSFKHVAVALGIVVVGVLALTSFGLPLASVLPLAAIALCPLMMIVMMVMMARGTEHDDHSRHDDTAMRP